MIDSLPYLVNDFLISLITARYVVIKKIIKEEFSKKKYTNVLDIGCGTGVLSTLFNKKYYLGFDIDENLIGYAKAKRPQYDFKVGDATNFKFKKKFDFVLVSGVIHHLDDKQVYKTLKLINLHLRRHGKAVLIEAIPPVKKWNLLGKIIRDIDRGAHIREVEEYNKLVKKCFKKVITYPRLGGIVDYAVIIIEK